MGMFDNITIDKSVKLPKPRGFSSFDFHDRLYQTKDLSCYLAEFRLIDGKLQERKSEYIYVEDKTRFMGGYSEELPNTAKWVDRSDITDYIYIYDLWYNITSTSDAWIEYVVHIGNGNIKTIKLFKFKLTDNAERKKRDMEFKDKLLKHKNRNWLQRFIDSIRYSLRVKLSWGINKLITFAHWIQRQIYKL